MSRGGHAVSHRATMLAGQAGRPPASTALPPILEARRRLVTRVPVYVEVARPRRRSTDSPHSWMNLCHLGDHKTGRGALKSPPLLGNPDQFAAG
jgi:hypothetical protein